MAGSSADLFDRFHLAIYRYLLRMTSRQDVAEDLTQDVFLRVLAADSRRPTETLAADSRRFPQKVATDSRRPTETLAADPRTPTDMLAADSRRFTQKSAADSRGCEQKDDDLAVPDSQRAWVFTIARNLLIDWQRRAGRNPVRRDTPEQTMHAAEATASHAAHDVAFEVREALQRLSDEDREAFLLRVVGGLGHEEIAALTGATAASVRSRIFRARAALRVALTPAPHDGTAAQGGAGQERGGRRMRVVP